MPDWGRSGILGSFCFGLGVCLILLMGSMLMLTLISWFKGIVRRGKRICLSSMIKELYLMV